MGADVRRVPRGIYYAHTMSPHPRALFAATEDDDDLCALPPMDGDDDDAPVDAFDADDLAPMDEQHGREDDGLVEQGLPIGDLIDVLPGAPDTLPEGDGAGVAEAAIDDDQTLSLLELSEGAVAFDDAGGCDDDDAEGVADDDIALGISELSELGQDDASEGTNEPLEDEVDESAYPELDDDEEDDGRPEVDIGDLRLPDEVPMPQWASVRWEGVSVPLVALPLRCVWCGSNRVVAAGDGAMMLSWEDDGAVASEFLPTEGRAGAELIGVGMADGSGSRIVFASRQRLMLSTDGGRTVRWVADVSHDGPAAALCRLEMGSIDATFAYAVTLQGRLLVSADRGRAWRAMDGIGAVRGLAIDHVGAAHVLAIQEEQWHWMRSDEHGRWESKLLRHVELSSGARPSMAVRGATRVLAVDDGTLLVSFDGGDTWNRSRVPPRLRSVAVIPGPSGDVVVGALFIESEDQSFLFAVEPDGEPELVADLSPDIAVDASDVDASEGTGRVDQIAWDDDRGCVWVAGEAGLSAWRRKLPT